MLYYYEIAVVPVFYAWAAGVRVVPDERDNAVSCREHRGILRDNEVNRMF
jgi:hypothetical protein